MKETLSNRINILEKDIEDIRKIFNSKEDLQYLIQPLESVLILLKNKLDKGHYTTCNEYLSYAEKLMNQLKQSSTEM